MSDQERLNSIKQRHEKAIQQPIFGATIHPNDVDWLIELAEHKIQSEKVLNPKINKLHEFLHDRDCKRIGDSVFDIVMDYVQELETKLSINTNNMKQLQDQNQRYKQALEWIKECSTDYQSRNKAMDALAGESD